MKRGPYSRAGDRKTGQLNVKLIPEDLRAWREICAAHGSTMQQGTRALIAEILADRGAGTRGIRAELHAHEWTRSRISGAV